MPTLSQCQILNTLVERNFSENVGKQEGENTQQGEQVSNAGLLRATTPQPTHSDPQYARDYNRPVSVGGKIETQVSTIETDHEVTPFQKQRMQMAGYTAQILPAWRPKSLWTRDAVAKWRTSSPMLIKPVGISYQRQKTYTNLFTGETKDRAFSPWRRTASQRQILVKPLIEYSVTPDQGSERNQLLPSSAPVLAEKVSSPFLTPITDYRTKYRPDSSENATRPSVHFDIKEPENEDDTETNQKKDGEKEDGAANAEQANNEENGEQRKGDDSQATQTAMISKKKLFLKCPDDVKEKLYLLGWRKPEKKKKKIKKKSEEKTRNARLTYMTVPKLDLMKDPMLRKLSKKSKNVMVQAHPPEMKPKAVCFSIVGAHLTHLLVWKSFQRDILSEYDEVKVESIQFVPRSIFVPRLKNADPVENRWVITLTNEWYRTRVTGAEIRFGDFTTQLRRYDDVVNLEYRQYTRMTDMMKMIKQKKS